MLNIADEARSAPGTGGWYGPTRSADLAEACRPGRVQTDITSKGLRDSEEERGEPQRFKFLCQTTYWRHRHTGATCRPIRSRHCADMTQDGLRIADTLGGGTEVVYPGLFSLFLLRKHFITEFFFKKKSGDVNYEANFSFFFCFIRELNPTLSPYLIPHSARELKPYTPPLPSPSPPRANSNPILPPCPLLPSTHPYLTRHP
jgi:hypothetical protein